MIKLSKTKIRQGGISAGNISAIKKAEKIKAITEGTREKIQPNTLTTVCKLKPGDVFTRLDGGIEYKKINHPATFARNHYYRCHAIRVDNPVMPVAFNEKTDVIYIRTETD